METVLVFFFSFEKIICSENQCKSKMFFQKRNWVPRNCSNSFVFGVESSYFEMVQVWSWSARIWDVSLYIFVYGGPHHPFDGENIRPVWIQNKNNNNPEVTTDGGSLLTWPRDIFTQSRSVTVITQAKLHDFFTNEVVFHVPKGEYMVPEECTE